VWGIVWWVSDIMCREVWSGGTCCVWGMVRWFGYIIFRELWSVGPCSLFGIYYSDLEV
jgi:hypothetical protein